MLQTDIIDFFHLPGESTFLAPCDIQHTHRTAITRRTRCTRTHDMDIHIFDTCLIKIRGGPFCGPPSNRCQTLSAALPPTSGPPSRTAHAPLHTPGSSDWSAARVDLVGVSREGWDCWDSQRKHGCHRFENGTHAPSESPPLEEEVEPPARPTRELNPAVLSQWLRPGPCVRGPCALYQATEGRVSVEVDKKGNEQAAGTRRFGMESHAFDRVPPYTFRISSPLLRRAARRCLR